MVHRSQKLQEFLTATQEAITARTGANAPAATAMQRVSASMDVPAPASDFAKPRTLPACAYFDPAIAGAMHGQPTSRAWPVPSKASLPNCAGDPKRVTIRRSPTGMPTHFRIGARSSRATGRCLDRIELDGSWNNLSGSLSSSGGSVPCTFARLLETRGQCMA
jgi:hypothetical protein